MVITNWNTVDFDTEDGTIDVDKGPAAVWVKIVSSWVCSLIYIWTLVAPALWPHRFGMDETEYI